MIDAQNSPFRACPELVSGGLGGRLINYKKKKAAQTGSFFYYKDIFQIIVPPERDCSIPNEKTITGIISSSMLNAIIISTPTKSASLLRLVNPVSNVS